jgi:hypothetical protein
MLGYLKVNFLLYENELTFQDEATSFCCENGNVSLPKLQPFPPTLKGIWETANFKANIRSYNSSLGFTSLGYKKDDRLAPNGIFTFRIQGTMYHNMGNLIPQKDEEPKFAQIYFYDGALASPSGYKIDGQIRESLRKMLLEVNLFAKSFRYVGDIVRTNSTIKP